MDTIRVAEFYSGIGGLRLSMNAAAASLDLTSSVQYVAAYDVNTSANEVYRHNFGEEPRPKTLNAVTLQELEELRANVWLLSPPCQPFTRNGKRCGYKLKDGKSVSYPRELSKHQHLQCQRPDAQGSWTRSPLYRMGSGDTRSSSFMYILGLVAKMREPPAFLFLENVVGFEQSAVRDMFIETLCELGLNDIVEFHLSPLQMGIPYSRPRYYCIARASRKLQIQSGVVQLRNWIPGDSMSPPLKLKHFLEDNINSEGIKSYALPVDANLLKNTAVLDVVSYNDERCNCFTKSYGSFWKVGFNFMSGDNRSNKKKKRIIEGNLKKSNIVLSRTKYIMIFPTAQGTGSVISQTGHSFQQPDVEAYVYGRRIRRYERPDGHDRNVEARSPNCETANGTELEGRNPAYGCRETNPMEGLKEMELRYFTEREICNLHGFPQEYSFPESSSRKQRFKLLGNSISVTVASRILQVLLSVDTERTIVEYLNNEIAHTN